MNIGYKNIERKKGMRIALVSDAHLGTRQYGLKERYDDFLASFENFGTSVADQRVGAVVIGGDLFDSPRPDAHSVLIAKNVVRDMQSSGTPVWGIDGNHDLAGGDWLRVIGVNPLPDAMVVDMGGVRVVGLSYRNGRDLVAELKEMADAGMKADVLVAHFALAEMNGGGSADTGVRELCPLLEKMGVKCVMMGHVHIPEARTWNGILFVNPGSTEMKSSNEPHDKFYFVVDTDTWTATEVRLETRQVETVEIEDEEGLVSFQMSLENEAKDRASIVNIPKQVFYQVIADDAVEDVFKRLSKAIHDTGALARIVMRSSRARDVAPVVDRAESVATLESAIEARFPKDSQEARLTASFLHSPDPSAIHLVVKRFMDGEDKK